MTEQVDRLVTISALISRHKMVSRSDVIWLTGQVSDLRARVKNIEEANDDLVGQINALQAERAADVEAAEIVSVYERALGVEPDEAE